MIAANLLAELSINIHNLSESSAAPSQAWRAAIEVTCWGRGRDERMHLAAIRIGGEGREKSHPIVLHSAQDHSRDPSPRLDNSQSQSLLLYKASAHLSHLSNVKTVDEQAKSTSIERHREGQRRSQKKKNSYDCGLSQPLDEKALYAMTTWPFKQISSGLTLGVSCGIHISRADNGEESILSLRVFSKCWMK